MIGRYVTGCIISSLFVLSAFAADMREISRDDLVAEVQRQVVTPPGMEPQEGEQAIERVRRAIADAAPDMLPASISAPAQSIDAAINTPVIINFSSQRYCDLLGRLALANVRLRLAYLSDHPPLSDASKTQLKENITTILGHAKETMVKHLTGEQLFTTEEVSQAVQNTEIKMLSRIGSNAMAQTLVSPLSEEQVRALLADFDARIETNAADIQKQLQRVGPRNDRTIPQRQAIAGQIVRTLEKVIERRTGPQGPAFDPDSVVAGYSKLAHEFGEVEHTLRMRGSSGAEPTTATTAPSSD